MKIRRATTADAPSLAHHWQLMFDSMGYDEAETRVLAENFVPWVIRRMDANTYAAWVVYDDGYIAASVGLRTVDGPPRPGSPTGLVGYVHGMYVEASHRRRKLGMQLMHTLLDHCRAEGLSAVGLHASDMGRPLYEKLGFYPTQEMARWLT